MDRKGIEIVKKFLGKVKKDFDVKKAILFGSRAGDDYLEESDFDIIVVSDGFEKVEFLDRMTLLQDYWIHNLSADVFGYTSKEFDKLAQMITIVMEANEKGIVIE
jgi:uncharacterized protein